MKQRAKMNHEKALAYTVAFFNDSGSFTKDDQKILAKLYHQLRYVKGYDMSQAIAIKTIRKVNPLWKRKRKST